MSADYCRIIFDNPHNTYFAGQTVSGRVEISLAEPKEIKGIRIEIKGAAHVRWTETERVTNSVGRSSTHPTHAGGIHIGTSHTIHFGASHASTSTSRSNTHFVTYHADEEYFYSRNHLVRNNNGDTFTLPAGNHVYMFSCPLLPSLPSSLEGEHGHIRYEAEVIAERAWIWNQRTKAVFTVISHYNLNMFQPLLSPVSVTAEKSFCCFCCRSGPLTGIIRIPRSGYVAGEQVAVMVEVDNSSNVDIAKIILKFQQLITFKATFPRMNTKDQKIVFVNTGLGSVQHRGSKTISYTLSIPPLPPSSLNESAIIDTKYQLLLEYVPNGCHTCLESAIPITIGTIPFTRVPESPPPGYEEAVGSNLNNQSTGWSGNVMPSAPVPTFSESEFFQPKSIQSEGDDEHTTYNNNFGQYAPVYPIYKYT